MLRTQLGNVYNRLHRHLQVERSQATHRQALGRFIIIFVQWHAQLTAGTETGSQWLLAVTVPRRFASLCKSAAAAVAATSAEFQLRLLSSSSRSGT